MAQNYYDDVWNMLCCMLASHKDGRLSEKEWKLLEEALKVAIKRNIDDSNILAKDAAKDLVNAFMELMDELTKQNNQTKIGSI